MRREAVPERFKTPWRKQKGHKESWGKHPWEGTKGVWQLREEKQLLSKQKCYQAQTLGELKKGNRNEAPGSVWEPGGSEQKWICADPPRTPSLWAGEKLPTWSSDFCLALCVPQGSLCWNVDCPYRSSDCSTNSLLQSSYLPVILFPFFLPFLTEHCFPVIWPLLCLLSSFHTLCLTHPIEKLRRRQFMTLGWYLHLSLQLSCYLLFLLCIFMPLLIFSASSGVHCPVLFIQLLACLFLFLADISRHCLHAFNNNDHVAF